MECPKCGSENVSIQMVQTEGKSKHKKKSVGKSLGRATMNIATLGLWALTPKSKGSSKESFKNEKIAICQGCANEWKVK